MCVQQAKLQEQTQQVNPRHLSGSILSVGASRGASLLSVALTSVVLAWIIGPAGIGTYAISQALLFVFTVLVELGLPQALAYYVARGEWGGERPAYGVIGACFALALPGCAGMLGAYALFGTSLPRIDLAMALALTVALPFSLLWRVVPQSALAQERFETFGLLDSSLALLLLPTSILGAVLGGTEGAVIGLSVATIASGGLIASWFVANSRRMNFSDGPPVEARAVLGFGLPAWGSELLMQLNLRVDLILVGVYAGTDDAGVYSVALSATSIAWMIMAAFSISALPRSARLDARAGERLMERGEQNAKDARTTRHAVLFAPAIGLTVLLLLVIGVPIFYGLKFDRSIWLGVILLPGSLLLGIGMVAVAILLGRRHTGSVMAICLQVVPATVIAYLLAVPTYGANGAAVVSSTSYAAFSILVATKLSAVSGIPLRELLIPRQDDIMEYRRLGSRAFGFARRRSSPNS